jgi:hypothetical protein
VPHISEKKTFGLFFSLPGSVPPLKEKNGSHMFVKKTPKPTLFPVLYPWGLAAGRSVLKSGESFSNETQNSMDFNRLIRRNLCGEFICFFVGRTEESNERGVWPRPGIPPAHAPRSGLRIRRAQTWAPFQAPSSNGRVPGEGAAAALHRAPGCTPPSRSQQGR